MKLFIITLLTLSIGSISSASDVYLEGKGYAYRYERTDFGEQIQETSSVPCRLLRPSKEVYQLALKMKGKWVLTEDTSFDINDAKERLAGSYKFPVSAESVGYLNLCQTVPASLRKPKVNKVLRDDFKRDEATYTIEHEYVCLKGYAKGVISTVGVTCTFKK